MMHVVGRGPRSCRPVAISLTLHPKGVRFYLKKPSTFRYCKVGVPKMISDIAIPYRDESVPAHPDVNPDHPMVVFGDHKFCAGARLEVLRMPGVHMHSQIELNLVLSGSMSYWFDGRELTVSAGQLAIFWGMIPHQVTRVAQPTQFVCLYVPLSVLLALPALSRLRSAILQGAMVEALGIKPFDRDIFLRWRDELLSGDEQAEGIVRDELSARVRRLDREGWRDLRATAPVLAGSGGHEQGRVLHVEHMARFICEKSHEDICVEDVAAAAGLHPNYAMTIYRSAVGLTINQSILRHRLDTARSLLVATDRPVVQIAFEAGFGSLSRFYEAFERRFHTAPGAFRQRLT